MGHECGYGKIRLYDRHTVIVHTALFCGACMIDSVEESCPVRPYISDSLLYWTGTRKSAIQYWTGTRESAIQYCTENGEHTTAYYDVEIVGMTKDWHVLLNNFLRYLTQTMQLTMISALLSQVATPEE